MMNKVKPSLSTAGDSRKIYGNDDFIENYVPRIFLRSKIRAVEKMDPREAKRAKLKKKLGMI